VKLFDQSRIVHSALFEIPERLGMAPELLLIEDSGSEPEAEPLLLK
jgi:hypothetical protein